jgi:hypothetical protein
MVNVAVELLKALQSGLPTPYIIIMNLEGFFFFLCILIIVKGLLLMSL